MSLVQKWWRCPSPQPHRGPLLSLASCSDTVVPQTRVLFYKRAHRDEIWLITELCRPGCCNKARSQQEK